MTELGKLVVRVDTGGPTSATDSFIYIDLSSIDAERKLIVSPRQLLAAEAPSRARQRVKPGDVLVSTVRPNLNGVALISNELDGAIASTGFCVLRSIPGQLDARYLFHWVRSELFVDEMVRRATGASYPAVSDAIVKSSRIPLPPLPEQRRIASILDQADALRAKRRRSLAIIAELADSLFGTVFHAALPTVPEVSFGDVVIEIQNGLYVPNTDYGSGVPILRIADYGGGDRLSLSDLNRVRISEVEARRYGLLVSDILINRVNAMSHVGKAALVVGVPEPTVFESNMMRVRLDSTHVFPEYVLAWLQTSNARHQIQRSARQAINQASVNQQDVSALQMPLPGRDVQREFVAQLQEIAKVRTANSGHLKYLNELFASLQNRAFRGEL